MQRVTSISWLLCFERHSYLKNLNTNIWKAFWHACCHCLTKTWHDYLASCQLEKVHIFIYLLHICCALYPHLCSLFKTFFSKEKLFYFKLYKMHYDWEMCVVWMWPLAFLWDWDEPEIFWIACVRMDTFRWCKKFTERKKNWCILFCELSHSCELQALGVLCVSFHISCFHVWVRMCHVFVCVSCHTSFVFMCVFPHV